MFDALHVAHIYFPGQSWFCTCGKFRRYIYVVKYVSKILGPRPQPQGWHKCVTSSSGGVFVLLVLLATIALAVPIYRCATGATVVPRIYVLVVVAIVWIPSLFIHEVVHLFAYPSQARLASTEYGIAFIQYKIVKRFPVLWITVPLVQKNWIYLWTVIAPFALLGLVGAVTAAFFNNLWGVGLGTMAAANLIGSRNDVCVAREVLRLGAKEILDEPFGFYWC